MTKKSYRSIAKQYCDSIRLDKGCAICGYSKFASALDFHHIVGEKGGNIATLQGKAMFDEMKKCVVLCSRCHREVHGGLHGLKSFRFRVITQDDIGFLEWESTRLDFHRKREVDRSRKGLLQFGSREDRRKTAMKLALQG